MATGRRDNNKLLLEERKEFEKTNQLLQITDAIYKRLLSKCWLSIKCIFVNGMVGLRRKIVNDYTARAIKSRSRRSLSRFIWMEEPPCVKLDGNACSNSTRETRIGTDRQYGSCKLLYRGRVGETAFGWKLINNKTIILYLWRNRMVKIF